MRFRAELSNIATFQYIVSSVSTLAKQCIIKLTAEKVHIICMGDISSSTQVWAQIDVNVIFAEYRIESSAGNMIYLEVVTEALKRALNSGQGATEAVIRLTKKGATPILSLAIKSASHTGKAIDILQEISVRVLKQADMDNLKEPLCPDPDVTLYMPSLKGVQVVVERMRNISSHIIFTANKMGELRLSVEDELAKIETVWKNLKQAHFENSQAASGEEEDDPRALHAVKIDIKMFLKFLSTHQGATSTIACVCNEHAGIFHVYLSPDSSVTGGILTCAGYDGHAESVSRCPCTRRSLNAATELPRFEKSSAAANTSRLSRTIDAACDKQHASLY
ncbi:uncharacterized protein L969DRAFT_102273 [Mixia osmundae IAM 14324]|uniref:Checkpoint protein n=1 Tax=Mixia osmundae (strain CBS 9802 / IAM 14324 / JCM 22182 / KY 12970) TaxID=764103 RepID=G7E5C8_MIXOS|nr:uncharacterized protein L969DRAFT_102273 [Mixia osmundae IAM 14324]KEI40809.1 hypothetical protein L969DRAFT_102273 [Mixia osmundae IAM 14324]GAA98038.1 hypothetical protein E5Q_04719 [Mixia osmundae IAM 14324]